MPNDFHRASKPSGGEGLDIVFNAHPVPPGRNVNGINSYENDTTSGDFSNSCLFYENFVNQTIRGLYPNPTGVLRKVLNINLDFYFEGAGAGNECTQLFPYGKDN